MSGEIVMAAANKPYLCLVVAIEPRLIFDLATEAGELLRQRSAAAPSFLT